ncbi:MULTISPECIES: endonuclease/exonuclease/phosphatase family protein [Kribbella]|uniref:Endonuclease/exonuclease/phosphatase family metal-dependent hydrolase n=1 Tax=Kribbella pratensis TaxID=2512112 RepID=A0ABY2FDW9_9ACTN|nr:MULTISPECIES: endonuclease/exonuclease/phosphatase family protein [Kribbella]TDW81269.1 endonuclease/exonuclease/phosphatase family metal-dependent hydrolase [Kribbella sp. VKM Ac-2566]TDW88436.1 endonuclease/exonuclease/phosphatase family metal-dependent hydrolase [Kribbella pratensis]
MRLATLNVWGVRGDWPARLALFRKGFQQLNADVLTLQETVFNADVDQVMEMLGPEYHVVHSSEREYDGSGISTASRWPIGDVLELDLNVTDRTGDFACTALLTEVLAPFGRVWVANHFPDYQVDHERERCAQTVLVARKLEQLVSDSPGHVVVAGDLDADDAADSLRFWTGRHVVDNLSVCYRSAWQATHPHEPLETFVPENPLFVDGDWPYRGLDHILVRCGADGRPTLPIQSCRRTFDQPGEIPSDHYGLAADFEER